MTHPGPPVRFREEPVPGCRSPYPRPPARGPEGTPGLALSLPFSPPRAVLIQVVMEAWAGWTGAEVTPVSPTDVPSIPGAYGHSLGNALGWSLGFPEGGGGERWPKRHEPLIHPGPVHTPPTTWSA